MRVIGKALGIVALILAGCGSEAVVGKTASGGTIEGTISGAGSQTLLVEVPGGAAATTTDASGGFVLTDVPEGTGFLRFSGGTVNATLAIHAVVPTEYRRLTVSVSGTSVTEHSEQTETEFRGQIEDVDATNKVVTVSGRKVAVTDATVIKKGDATLAFADLAKGQFVEVRGTLQADGTVAARGISIKPDGTPDDPNALTLVGTLNAITGTDLTVSGLPVDAKTAEIVKGDVKITAADLHVGDHLLVRGVFTNGKIVASKIRVLGAVGEPPDFHVAGKVTAVAAADKNFTVGDTKVLVNDSTEFEGEGSFHSLADLKVGDFVDAEVVKQADGSLLAKEVKRVGAPPPPSGLVEVKGLIKTVGTDNVVLSQPAPTAADPTVTVEVKLLVNASTVIMRGDTKIGLDGLKVGEPAFAKATKANDGTLTALGIYVAPPSTGGDLIEVRGAVGAVDATAKTVVIGDQTLTVNADTVILRGTQVIGLGDLVKGEAAVAKAVKDSTGKLIAKGILVAPPPAPGTEFDLTGTVDNVGNDGVTIGGKRLLVNAATQIRRGDLTIKLSDLKLGELAQARVTTATTGALVALKIQVKAL